MLRKEHYDADEFRSAEETAEYQSFDEFPGEAEEHFEQDERFIHSDEFNGDSYIGLTEADEYEPEEEEEETERIRRRRLGLKPPWTTVSGALMKGAAIVLSTGILVAAGTIGTISKHPEPAPTDPTVTVTEISGNESSSEESKSEPDESETSADIPTETESGSTETISTETESETESLTETETSSETESVSESETETESETEHVHAFGAWAVSAAASCTSGGSEYRTCDCGEKETRNTSALGHAFGGYSTLTAPDCTNAGTERRVCGRCGEKEDRSIAKLGHDYSGTSVYSAYDCDEMTGTDQHIRTVTTTCIRCGTEKTSTEKAPTYVSNNDVLPCGYTTYDVLCTICNMMIDSGAHRGTACVDDGTGYCNYCGRHVDPSKCTDADHNGYCDECSIKL